MSQARQGGGRGRLARRSVLRGAGVALALPWLESFELRSARAQAAPSPLRFVPIFQPSGVAEFWKPPLVGEGSAWQLSSVLEPIAAFKSRVTVITGLENGSVFNADGSSSVEPAHGRQPGAWLTCVDSRVVTEQLGAREGANGISVDQVMAAHPNVGQWTRLDSLQLGISSVFSYCDGAPCSLGRSISWRSPTEPLYKKTDPKQAFDLLVGASSPSPDVAKRIAERKSVLDATVESARVVRARLSASDQQRLDQYLQAVRDVEKRMPAIQPGCQLSPPTNLLPNAVLNGDGYSSSSAVYQKGAHADMMNDLIVLAFQCDATRIISYMLEDEYCEFSYNEVPRRKFTATTSTPDQGVCGNYSGAQHGSQDEYATVNWWHVGKVASLCAKLAAVPDIDGKTLLDNTVLFIGSSMHGSNHACDQLPCLLIGNGGGTLKTDHHIDVVKRPMRDFYFTLMNYVFGMAVKDFGVNRTGAPIARIDEMLA